MKRDLLLDVGRSLIMIYIVCCIHVVYWLFPLSEPWQSLLLFEMPVIFLISGASQSLARCKGLWAMIINRMKRVILPLYVFLAVMAVFYAMVQPFCPAVTERLTVHDILKILATGGCDKIPYYGYTWFISTYLVVTCLLPIERKLSRWIPLSWQLTVNVLLFAAIQLLPLPMEIDGMVCYNIFFLLGYLYYRKLRVRTILLAASLPTLLTAYGFLSGAVIPMQDHKFPADLWFLCFGFTAICWWSILYTFLEKHEGAVNYLGSIQLIQLWNTRGYTIYIYQTISAFIVSMVTRSWIDTVPCHFLGLMIYVVITFAVATLLSCLTYPFERFILRRIV